MTFSCARHRLVLIVSVLLASTGRSSRAADCTPAATVTGDPEAALEVARELSQLGIDDGTGERACPAIAVVVHRDPSGLAITLRSSERRIVSEPATAATWIESRMRDDAAPLWTALPQLALAAPSLTRAIPQRPRSHRRWPTIALFAAWEASPEGDTWDGGGAAACYPIAGWCLGLAGRYVATTSYVSDDPDDGSGGTVAARRASTVFAATIERALRVARVAITPRLAVGLAHTRSKRHEPDPPCFATDCAQMITYIGDGFTASNTALRFGPSIGIAVPLTGWLFLDGRIGLELAAGAHPSPHRHDAERYPVEPSVGISAGDPLLDLPGDPSRLITGMLGLRVEVP